jgi:hypothetical protein
MSVEGLIHIYVPSVEGINGLKRNVFNLRKSLGIVKASVIYKRYSQAFQRQQIEVVLKVKIDDDEMDLRELQKALGAAKAILLVLNGVLRVDPDITLPHPDLLRDPFLLKMAAEVEPFWEHRVNQETLQALQAQFPSTDQVELLTQGSELINLTIKGLA